MPQGNGCQHRAPLCGEEPVGAGCTDEPEAVTGCDDCLEMVAEDLAEDNDYQGRCLHCRQDVAAKGGVQWRRAVRRACPHCGQRGGNRSRRRFLFSGFLSSRR